MNLLLMINRSFYIFMADIHYWQIVKNSWEMTKKNRWLWVYGLVLAITGESSMNFRNFSSSGSSGTKSPPVKDIPNDSAQKVLGAATDAISQFVSGISPAMWISIGLLFTILIIIGALIAWVARSWAKAGLIYAIHSSSSLETSSPTGKASVKPLIIYSILIGLIEIALFIGIGLFSLLCIAIIAFIPLVGYIFMGLGFLILIPLLIIGFIMISIMSVYAERLIVLYRFSPQNAIKRSFLLAKKHVFPTILMGLTNSGISCGAGCVSIVALLVIIAPIGILSYVFLDPMKAIVISVGCFLLLFLTGMQLFNALIIVWRYGTWHEFFMTVVTKEDTTP